MFILPDLPYAKDALEPTMSAQTFSFHHDKHHKAYVDTLNALLADKGETPDSLEAVVKSAGPGKLFNNAAQAWNHAFFWLCMTPDYKAPAGDLAAAIEAFGGLDALKAKFVETGVGQFGSGWVWIVAKGEGLEIVSTHDAGTPITEDGVTPILVCDVWEHAYYLDRQNDRKGFLTAWFETLANWDFATKQLAAAKGDSEAYTYPKPVA
jgi:Fe-Mn family superoxide dismutase